MPPWRRTAYLVTLPDKKCRSIRDDKQAGRTHRQSSGGHNIQLSTTCATNPNADEGWSLQLGQCGHIRYRKITTTRGGGKRGADRVTLKRNGVASHPLGHSAADLGTTVVARNFLPSCRSLQPQWRPNRKKEGTKKSCSAY